MIRDTFDIFVNVRCTGNDPVSTASIYRHHKVTIKRNYYREYCKNAKVVTYILFLS